MQEALDLSFDRLLMMMMMMMMMIDSPFFSLQNSVCFIILTYLVTVLFTFYIQCVLKLKKNNSDPKRLRNTNKKGSDGADRCSSHSGNQGTRVTWEGTIR